MLAAAIFFGGVGACFGNQQDGEAMLSERLSDRGDAPVVVLLTADRPVTEQGARGVAGTSAPVEEVFRRYGLGKNTAPTRARRSRH